MPKTTFLHTFYSTHFIMQLESELKSKGIKSFRLIPTPREISSECGFSLLSSTTFPDALGLDSIYQKTMSEKGPKYEKIN